MMKLLVADLNIKQAYEIIASIPLKQHIDAFGITIYKKCPVTG